MDWRDDSAGCRQSEPKFEVEGVLDEESGFFIGHAGSVDVGELEQAECDGELGVSEQQSVEGDRHLRGVCEF